MQNILLIFIDGIGIGEADKEVNPFFRYGFKTFTHHFGGIPTLEEPVIEGSGRYIFPVDALLGIPGLPQSGTGQTAIFCGLNAPKILGRHFGPYPPTGLVPIIKDNNIFKDVLNAGLKAEFVNAYPKEYFHFLATPKGKMTVTTLSCTQSGLELKNEKDLRAGNAISAEITNERWVSLLHYDIPVVEPETAAGTLLNITGQNSLTVFEFFLTDHAGHGREVGGIAKMTGILDRFLFEILAKLDYQNTTLLICSDHGNFENTGIKSHTLNPSLALAAGKNAKKLFETVQNISQIKGALLSLLDRAE